jgi:hypothetical protein
VSSLFQADSLLQSAASLAGSDDFGAPFFREGFEVLVQAWDEEAAMHPARAWRTCGAAVDLLVTRAKLAARLAARPQIAKAPVKSPLFITGLPRTGTTMLHNVLARLPGFRGFNAWELRAPVMPEGAGAEWSARQEAKVAEEIRALYLRLPGFERIHKVEAAAPDECSWLFRHSFTTLVFAFMWRMPSYLRWELSAPRHEAYADYRQQLQILGDPARLLPEQREGAAQQQLVLKDPCHLWHLDELLDTFPDAVVVQLHRDPAEAVSSLASLCHALQSMDSGHTDPAATGSYCLELADRGLSQMIKVRAARPKARFVDVQYQELLRDPIGEVERICEAVQRPLDERGAQAVSSWLGSHPHRPGAHRYRPEDFGLSGPALRERYGEYVKRFGVQLR